MLISAPTRLHFGLLHVPAPGPSSSQDGTPLRLFGGLGLMLDRPRVIVQVRPDPLGPYFSGSLAGRAQSIATAYQQHHALTPTVRAGRYRLEAEGPPEHTGLGVGTALTLAVHRGLRGLEDATRLESSGPEVWIPRTGRAQRSGVGAFGHFSGGFLLDRGRLPGAALPDVQRYDFPKAWRVLLVLPPAPARWHGEAERAAFQRGRDPASAARLTQELWHLAEEWVLPALQQADFDAFCTHLRRFNRLAGEPFLADQGGPYAGAEVGQVVDHLQSLGAAGVGQSSWGPTVFAFSRSAAEGEQLLARASTRLPIGTELMLVQASRDGAEIRTG